MSKDLMREQFEMALLGAMRANHPDDLLEIEDISGLRNGETYSHDAVALSWWSWKASREAVVVDLPCTVWAYPHPEADSEEYMWPEEVREAIEAQGLKVAP